MAPAPRKKAVSRRDPADAFKGTLAYFSGRTLSPTKKHASDRPQFPYDLSASPEALRQQSRNMAKIAGKHRTISAPQPRLYGHYGDELEDEVEQTSHSSLSSRSMSPPRTPMPRSHRSSSSRHDTHSHRHDDRLYSPKSTSHSSRARSQHHPVESVPRPTRDYRPPPQSEPRRYTSYDYPAPRGSFERPPPPTSARNMSYSWFNATTPLNL